MGYYNGGKMEKNSRPTSNTLPFSRKYLLIATTSRIYITHIYLKLETLHAAEKTIENFICLSGIVLHR